MPRKTKPPAPEVDDDQRYRLIPTKGHHRMRHIQGRLAARAEAQIVADSNDMPVMVCLAPVGGLVKALYTIHPAKAEK